MSLVIHSVANQGDHSQERVILRASDRCDARYYMLADTTYLRENTISNRLRNVHWFYPQALNKGDWVILYTRPGHDNVTKERDGSLVYHRYWGIQRPVWNDAGDRAILFGLNGWSNTPVK